MPTPNFEGFYDVWAPDPYLPLGRQWIYLKSRSGLIVHTFMQGVHFFKDAAFSAHKSMRGSCNYYSKRCPWVDDMSTWFGEALKVIRVCRCKVWKGYLGMREFNLASHWLQCSIGKHLSWLGSFDGLSLSLVFILLCPPVVCPWCLLHLMLLLTKPTSSGI